MHSGMNSIFKHTDKFGEVHILQENKARKLFLYIHQARNGNTKGWKWLDSEEKAKEYLIKATGRNPYKEVIIEEEQQ